MRKTLIALLISILPILLAPAVTIMSDYTTTAESLRYQLGTLMPYSLSRNDFERTTGHLVVQLISIAIMVGTFALLLDAFHRLKRVPWNVWIFLIWLIAFSSYNFLAFFAFHMSGGP
jgi:hypothetical protein